MCGSGRRSTTTRSRPKCSRSSTGSTASRAPSSASCGAATGSTLRTSAATTRASSKSTTTLRALRGRSFMLVERMCSVRRACAACICRALDARRVPCACRAPRGRLLRWSWTESLLLDEIVDIHYSPGSTAFTIQYFQPGVGHGAAKLSLSLLCSTVEVAAMWVSGLRGLQRAEAVQHNLDVHQRARLKAAFRTVTKEPRLRVDQQVASPTMREPPTHSNDTVPLFTEPV
eukprot:3244205-Prymnesium_polylepis.1